MDGLISQAMSWIAWYLYFFYQGNHKTYTYYREFNKNICLSPENIQALQLHRVKKMLIHARARTDFYAERIPTCEPSMSTSEIKDVMSEIPITTREDIEQFRSEMISRNYSENDLVPSMTGGTSGSPTRFYRDMECQMRRQGHHMAINAICGYKVGDRRALIWGAPRDIKKNHVLSIKDKIKSAAIDREVVLSAQFLEESTIAVFAEKLMKFEPAIIYGYPNGIYELVKYMENKNMFLKTVKRVITTAEHLSETKRHRIENYLKCPVYDLYGSREHGIMAFECHEHSGYHIDITSIWIDIVVDGKIKPSGAQGELIVTDLLNYGMPLIRYKIGDIGKISDHACPCGNPLPLLSDLGGRYTDLIRLPNGQVVSGVLLVDLAAEMQGIRRTQLVQTDLGHIDVLIEPSARLEESDIQKLNERLSHYLSDIDISYQVVERIEASPHSGKIRDVISMLN